jgi:hypothetical protein
VALRHSRRGAERPTVRPHSDEINAHLSRPCVKLGKSRMPSVRGCLLSVPDGCLEVDRLRILANRGKEDW